ncbi:MAG: VOC family protein [Acidimicrobiia bacterium]|nr:VOC family protein [Acidimicrobiia bacterium]
MKLDHVAIATPDARDLLVHLVGTLGGVVIGGDQGVGFRPMQIRVGDGERGMTVEILEPWRTSDNDFLERFLDSNGPGPHHLTFKVRDIDDTLALVRDAGYSPVGVNTSDPVWKEFFLHPREAHGTVVQLAESGGGDLSGPGALSSTSIVTDLTSTSARGGPILHPGGRIRHGSAASSSRVRISVCWKPCTGDYSKGARSHAPTTRAR